MFPLADADTVRAFATPVELNDSVPVAETPPAVAVMVYVPATHA